ncbi:MAG: phosphate acetyltransferase [Spirochaetales bacterium]|nr:phosphate acetyltransferase [Spirochaetales bacterium]
MTFIEKIKKRAQSSPKKLVLPEGTDSRILEAARILVDEKLVSDMYVLGNKQEIYDLSKSLHLSLDNINIEEPGDKAYFEEYINEYYTLRKAKGETIEQARENMRLPIYWGAMMVRKKRADAMVAGAITSTANVLRASLKIVKTAPGTKVASSCFVMSHEDPDWGCNGQLIFSDCGTIPSPDAEQLSEIAITAAGSCRKYLGVEPVVALLSYSTKGSAQHAAIDKVREALAIIKEKAPDLIVDGELQADAALVPEVAAYKAPDSPVKGKANVLVFPDLGAGNIGYKLVQRLARVEAYGPLLQGFSHPLSDLSRGCTVQDVVIISVLTLLDASKQ